MSAQPTGTVTFLFTDIEGSTRLLQRAGEAYADLLAEHRRLLRNAFENHGGREVDTEGDAFFVAFSSAEEAVGAAAEGQQALAAQAWPDGNEIRVRIGIHTGEPALVGGDYVGLDVHRAARVMAAAHGGQVLISDRTRKQLGDGTALLDLGEHRLKDLLQPEHLYQLLIEGLPSQFPALKTLGNRPTNLPTQPNPLIGREEELRRIGEHLRIGEARLLTLTGTGGTGKTRLALQAGAELLEEFASGVFFVSLAPIRDPNLLIPTIAQTLAVREAPGEQLLDTLCSYLEEKEMLLLLDNFEQIVEAAPPLATLVACCPKLKLVVTSRQRLRLAAELVFEVPPLTLPDDVFDLSALAQNDSVALFLARAQATKPEFELSGENAVAVARICEHLEGLPLAIELAAARVSVLSPEALAERLNERLELLTGGVREADERQQTLRKTIEWSYDLLTRPEQILFACLSVFVGGCRMDAVEAVCDPQADHRIELLDGLQSLVEKSLLRQKRDPDGEPRFWMLETIREYAAERVDASGASAELRQRQADYCLALAEGAEARLRGRDQQTWFERFEAEHDNVRSALAWLIDSGNGDEALRIAEGVWFFWLMRGHLREGRRWVEQALEHGDPAPSRRRAWMTSILAEFLRFEGDYGGAAAIEESVLELCRELGEERMEAATLHALGEIAFLQRDYERARRLHEESLRARQEIGERAGITHALTGLADLALHEGDYAEAKARFEEILATGRDLDRPEYVVTGLGGLAEVARRQGDYPGAEAMVGEAMSLAHEGGIVYAVADGLETVGRIAAARDDPALAVRLWGAAGALREASGFAVFYAAEQERWGAATRAQMSEENFLAAEEEGRRMTRDEAVAYALEQEDAAPVLSDLVSPRESPGDG